MAAPMVETRIAKPLSLSPPPPHPFFRFPQYIQIVKESNASERERDVEKKDTQQTRASNRDRFIIGNMTKLISPESFVLFPPPPKKPNQSINHFPSNHFNSQLCPVPLPPPLLHLPLPKKNQENSRSLLWRMLHHTSYMNLKNLQQTFFFPFY